MKLSARNQLLVEISEVKRGAVNSEIIAKLDEGENLRAIITEQSEEALGLTVNKKVLFIFKASSVILGKVSNEKDLLISAANKIKGKVCDIKLGAVNAEVIIQTRSNHKISSIITNESVKNLDIKMGDEVLALIKASNILIGVNK